MTELPDRPRSRLPERRISPEQFEAVIRRAAELQSREGEGAAGEGIAESEAVRIAREIGISPANVHRALAEVSAESGGPPTLAERIFGPGWVRASRTVPGEAEAVFAHIDEYLTEREWLAPLRRFPGRTIYTKAGGLDLARILGSARASLRGDQPIVGAGFKLKKARRVEAAVQPLADGSTHVSLAADVGNSRTGFAVATVAGGGGTGMAVAMILAIAVDPAAALLGVPVLGGFGWGMRTLQVGVAASAQTHLEAILDSLERGEALVRRRT